MKFCASSPATESKNGLNRSSMPSPWVVSVGMTVFVAVDIRPGFFDVGTGKEPAARAIALRPDDAGFGVAAQRGLCNPEEARGCG